MSDSEAIVIGTDDRPDVARRLREAGATAALVDAVLEWMAANPGRGARVHIATATLEPIDAEKTS